MGRVTGRVASGPVSPSPRGPVGVLHSGGGTNLTPTSLREDMSASPLPDLPVDDSRIGQGLVPILGQGLVPILVQGLVPILVHPRIVRNHLPCSADWT